LKKYLILVLSVVVIAVAIIAVGVSISQSKSDARESSHTESTTSSSRVTETEPAVVQPTEDEAAAAPTEDTESTDSSSQAERDANESAASIVLLAKSLIGIDFADGGESPQTGFDNSGFIYYVFRENGYITCPRGVSAQSEWGTAVTYDELVAGDLVFFSEGGSTAEFGGIYIGDGAMVACLMPGTQVKEVNITTDYYRTNFFRGVAIS